MEQPQQLQNVQNDQEGVGGCNGGGKSSSYLCRQSSTRWTPTTDQIRILKELYYNNGVRSPNAEQIQRISARLRQYGKIEGKNVFYWFQNHKARERQKKRFTTPTTTNADHHLQLHRSGNNCATAIGHGFWKAEDSSNFQTKYPTANPGLCASSSSSPVGVVPLGQMVGSFGYGPMMTMENNFRDCSISAGGANACNGVSFGNNFQGCGGAQCYTFLDDKISSEVLQEGGEGDEPELETLPLFPMHGEDNSPLNFSFMKSDVDNYYGGCYNGGSRACLELSLNSYGGNGHIFN